MEDIYIYIYPICWASTLGKQQLERINCDAVIEIPEKCGVVTHLGRYR